MYIVSLGNNLYEMCQSLFSRKNKKSIISLSFAESVQRVVKFLKDSSEVVLTSTHNLCFEQKYGKYQSLYLKIFSLWRWNFLYIWIGQFVMHKAPRKWTRSDCAYAQVDLSPLCAHVIEYVWFMYSVFTYFQEHINEFRLMYNIGYAMSLICLLLAVTIILYFR